jgi:hypothetical protein
VRDPGHVGVDLGEVGGPGLGAGVGELEAQVRPIEWTPALLAP